MATEPITDLLRTDVKLGEILSKVVYRGRRILVEMLG
jgi:hypothetical protein